jgi:hypothetical protein
LRRFGIGLLCAVAGYIVGAVVSYFLVLQLSGNVHDRGVEAAMTSAFFYGPIVAVIALVVGIVRSGRGAKPPDANG